jgi:hypothetical protein
MGVLKPGAGTAFTRDRFAYAFVLLCAAVVRFAGLLHHATMPDEAFTFFIAAHPLPAIVELLKSGDFHPPLLYGIGHLLFGLTSRAYLFRVVTAAFGVAGVAATYTLARRVIPRWAIAAMLLVAINPSLAFFDGFFRMYAMLWSLCMISWALLLWALDQPQRWPRWLAYALCLTALLYTQYLAFFTLAAQIAYVFLFFRRTAGYWLATLAAVIAFAPWVPVFIIQYPLGGTAYNALHGHLNQLGLLTPVLLVDGLPSAVEFSLLVCIGLWALVLGGLSVALARKNWLAIALVAPIVGQLAYSLASGKLLFGQRYLLQAIVPMVLLCLLFIDWLWSTRLRPLALGLLAALGAMMLAGTIDKHMLPQYMPIDWTQYRQFLDARIKPGDGVVFDGSMVYYVLIGSKAAGDRPLFLVTNPQEAASYGAAAARLKRVWYIGYQSELPDPKRVVFRELERTHPRHQSWISTDAAYGDSVLTTLFLAPEPKRGP